MSYTVPIALLCFVLALGGCATNDYIGPPEDAGNSEDDDAGVGPSNSSPGDGPGDGTSDGTGDGPGEGCIDRDGDGFGEGCVAGPDCVDLDNAINPDADEICDGKDNDCSGFADDGLDCGSECIDADGDGYGPNCDLGLDCDDTDGDRFPGNPEVCDGKDNNCDQNVDETFSELGQPCVSGLGACEREGTYVCGVDADVECSATPGPSSAERCNGIDDDCDGMVDDGLNCDSCTEDPYEPNDSSGTGTQLNAGQSLSAVRCPDDQGGTNDWYQLGTLSAGTTVTLNLEFSHADGDIDLDLYEGGTFAAASASETDDESITYTMQSNARLDARVYTLVGLGVRGVSYTITRQ